MPASPLSFALTHRTFSFKVKAVDDEQGIIEAYGSVFSIQDDGDDVVSPGAFARTIQHSKQRVSAGKTQFLAKMLWQHDPGQPIGGWYDLSEDTHGLLCKGRIILTTQLGREVYELIKAGVINEFSIGYDIPKGGSDYDSKTGIRTLKEVRLWEVSPVTFAMNNEALLVGVKGASGSTSLPLAPDETAWEKSAALKDIEAATDNDWSKAAKYFFWVAKNPPENEADCKLPFAANVDGTMKAIPRAIESVGAVLMGAMGGADIDDVAGVKERVASYYKKMDKTAPWEDATDDETAAKSASIPSTPSPTIPHSEEKRTRDRMNRKDFNDRYRQQRINDWLCDDFYSITTALKQAIQDLFAVGDTPQTDLVDLILNDSPENTIGLVTALKNYVQKGIDLDYANYLQEQQTSSPSGYGSFYGMSNSTELERKAGAAFSQDNKNKILAKANQLKETAMQHKSAVAEHVKALNTVADDLATILQGSEAAYGTDPGTPEDGTQEGKSARQALTPSDAPTRETSSLRSEASTGELEAADALLQLRKLKRLIRST